MIVSIHQPNYLPWLGFFDKIKRSDIFVVFDDVQFPRGNCKHFGHRNKIKTNTGTKWLTVPIKNKSGMVSFNDTIINYDTDWQDKHCKLMVYFYNKTPYFSDYHFPIFNIIQEQHNSLTELSVKLIKYFMKELNIDTEIVYSSQLNPSGFGSEKIFSILENLNATEYITGSGTGSQRYINEEAFGRRNINLQWQDYKCKEYNQLFGDFIPYLSVVDLLFNHGKKAGEVI